MPFLLSRNSKTPCLPGLRPVKKVVQEVAVTGGTTVINSPQVGDIPKQIEPSVSQPLVVNHHHHIFEEPVDGIGQIEQDTESLLEVAAFKQSLKARFDRFEGFIETTFEVTLKVSRVNPRCVFTLGDIVSSLESRYEDCKSFILLKLPDSLKP